ncbi:MAG: caspase family protein, partial [Pseudomonadota bacterium]
MSMSALKFSSQHAIKSRGLVSLLLCLTVVSSAISFGSLSGVAHAETNQGQTKGSPTYTEDIQDEAGDKVLAYTTSAALVIGISDYKYDKESGGPWEDLPSVKEDVSKISDALRAHGFVVEPHENLTGEEVKSIVQKFIDKYNDAPDASSTRLVVYFSGHGGNYLDQYDNSQPYLIAADTPDYSADKGTFWKSTISTTNINEWANKADLLHMLFIFDSCFSGDIFGSIERSSEPAALEANITAPVRFFITAGQKDEKVRGDGIFRESLVSALNGNVGYYASDGYLTSRELGEFIRRDVTDREKKLYGDSEIHTPTFGELKFSNLRGGQLVFTMPSYAEYRPISNGVEAYRSADYEAAISDWIVSATAGDQVASKILGDYYSGASLARYLPADDSDADLEFWKSSLIDYPRALAWYFSAVAPSGADCACGGIRENKLLSDVLRESRARIYELRNRMGTSQIREAEALFSKTYASGNISSLFELGGFHRQGFLVTKDNSKAALFYTLARDRGLAEAALALDDTISLMTVNEISDYKSALRRWQPPLSAEMRSQVADRFRTFLDLNALEGVRDVDVVILQLALKGLGFYDGPADDRMSDELRDAIRRYQFATIRGLTAEEANSAATGMLTAGQTTELLIEAAEKANVSAAQYALGLLYL